jgi:hypothetical protein
MEGPSPGRVADVLNFYRDNIPKGGSLACPVSAPRISPYTIGFHFRDWDAPVFTLFDFGNPSYAQSRYFPTVEQTTEKPALFDGNPPGDDLLKWNAMLVGSQKQGYLVLFKEKDFPELGVRAKIYVRKI